MIIPIIILVIIIIITLVKSKNNENVVQKTVSTDTSLNSSTTTSTASSTASTSTASVSEILVAPEIVKNPTCPVGTFGFSNYPDLCYDPAKNVTANLYPQTYTAKDPYYIDNVALYVQNGGPLNNMYPKYDPTSVYVPNCPIHTTPYKNYPGGGYCYDPAVDKTISTWHIDSDFNPDDPSTVNNTNKPIPYFLEDGNRFAWERMPGKDSNYVLP